MLMASDLRPGTALVVCCGAGVILTIAIWLYLRFLYVDFAKIAGIPEIPNGELVAGHLYQLKQDHAETLYRWSLKYGWPVFQARMGYRRVVFLNSFDTAQEWITKNHDATADRPWFYTFHGVISKTSAATIAANPWNERTKKQRRVFASYTTAPSIKKMRPMLDFESYDLLREMFKDSLGQAEGISPHVYMKRLALNSMTMFAYGTRFSSSQDPLFHQILSDAKTIASFRSSNSNHQDFIPHLRYLPRNDRFQTAFEVRGRRDQWLKAMFEGARQAIGRQELPHKPVVQLMLADDQNGLTDFDFKSMLNGAMSGGSDTLATSSLMGIGILASPMGQKMQQKAFDDLLGHYETPEQAFQFAVDEEKSTYISAFVKEVLRFYPPLRLLPARQTFNEFEYHGARIPKGVLLYLNCQAINRDPVAYGPDADVFRPERWLERESRAVPLTLYTFGAGARVCTGVNFAQRVLYAVYARSILAFRIQESKQMPVNTDYLDYNSEPSASNTTPKDFKITLSPRNKDVLQRCFQKSREMSGSTGLGSAPT